ncbi:hypothetical protein CBM2589_A90202 [Cupriavidus taiwanensis]|uniref:Uncharacterized protein n=1 Tax=Cupriavidus taiwanensis TaxID=164546 RepID=A0A375CF83_9BURK|nr:hypothetical protein CBM2589_A90202 [Cupriavidus taiwanensis]
MTPHRACHTPALSPGPSPASGRGEQTGGIQDITSEIQLMAATQSRHTPPAPKETPWTHNNWNPSRTTPTLSA